MASWMIHLRIADWSSVLHRLNDCEDKWIVSTDGKIPDKSEILKTIDFQEQYFMGELYI